MRFQFSLLTFLSSELGEFDPVEAQRIIEELGSTVKALHTKSEKDVEEFGKVQAATEVKLAEMADEAIELKKSLDALETQANRPNVPEEIASMSREDLLERADGVLKKMQSTNRERSPKELKESYWSANETDKKAIEGAYTPLWRKALATCEEKQMYVGMTDQEKRFMQEVKVSVILDDANAGYLLVPPELVSGILKDLTEVSPIRQLADVRSGSTGSIEQVRRTARPSGAWVAETGTRTETTGLAYGKITWTAHEQYAQLHSSRQMLADSAHNLEAEFRMEAVEDFANREGTAFVSGSGSGQPEGITTSSLITTKSAASSGVIAADDIIDITIGQIKEVYLAGASWLWNRANISRVLQLKDGQGGYLWSPGLAVGKPMLLYGYPWRTATDLSSAETASANVALFGDFRAGYRVYDRTGMEMIRDIYSSKDTGTVEFDFFRRTDGRVKKGEALVLYQL